MVRPSGQRASTPLYGGFGTGVNSCFAIRSSLPGAASSSSSNASIVDEILLKMLIPLLRLLKPRQDPAAAPLQPRLRLPRPEHMADGPSTASLCSITACSPHTGTGPARQLRLPPSTRTPTPGCASGIATLAILETRQLRCCSILMHHQAHGESTESVCVDTC